MTKPTTAARSASTDAVSDEQTIRLACLKLVWPAQASNANADPVFYVKKAAALVAWVKTGAMPTNENAA